MPRDRTASPFVVDVELFARETGRSTAIRSGYRASVARAAAPREALSAMLSALGPAADLEPGARGTAVLEPLVPASWSSIRVGEHLVLLEGTREVGRATVTGRPHWRTLRAASRDRGHPLGV